MNTDLMRVSVIGLGYIGLPTASLLATKGFQVSGCDVNPDVVETINRGEIHIKEHDLDILVRSAVNSGALRAYTTPQPADIFIIAVPTPFKEEHKPDIRYVETAVHALAPLLQPGNLVILESTSPLGTTEKIAGWLKKCRPDLTIPHIDANTQANPQQIYIAHCPERVLPGQIIRELVDNDRIVGGIDAPSSEVAKNFYQTFVSGTILLTNARTAEMSKLVENAYRDVNIAFANELSMICGSENINVWELIKLANHHPRVNILQPGPGVGGHCIAVDPWFIVDAAPHRANLIRTARNVNDEKPEYLLDQIQNHIRSLGNPTVACLGLSYKAEIDDLRESPAVYIVSELAAREKATTLLVVEPHIDTLPASLDPTRANIELTSLEQAVKLADIIVLLVDHHAFKEVNRSDLVGKIVIDTRGVWQ